LEDREYERIVRQYLDTVYRVALNGCKNPCDAEDVVQMTFLKLIRTKTVFEDETHIRKWLIRVAVNECHGIWRSFWKKNVLSLEEMTYEPSFSSTGYSNLFYAVQELPVKYREVIHLYYYEDYSIREIADILHISETAIQTRLMRARSQLKQQLKEAWNE